jgi:hypothetical protein
MPALPHFGRKFAKTLASSRLRCVGKQCNQRHRPGTGLPCILPKSFPRDFPPRRRQEIQASMDFLGFFWHFVEMSLFLDMSVDGRAAHLSTALKPRKPLQAAGTKNQEMQK